MNKFRDDISEDRDVHEYFETEFVPKAASPGLDGLEDEGELKAAVERIRVGIAQRFEFIF